MSANRKFKIHENGKIYLVGVRGAYQNTITCERKLRSVVEKSIEAQYGKQAAESHSFFELCDLLGILYYRSPIEK